jgi:hypothetical protein
MSDNPSDEFTAMQATMRDWRARPVPTESAPVRPETAALLGVDTPEGHARYQRLAAYREAGYTGPLDQDNTIPDPDDPANTDALRTLAALRTAADHV